MKNWKHKTNMVEVRDCIVALAKKSGVNVGNVVTATDFSWIGFDGKTLTSGTSGGSDFSTLEDVVKLLEVKPLKVGEYDCVFAEDGKSVKIGCTTVSLEKAEEVLARMEKLRAAKK